MAFGINAVSAVAPTQSTGYIAGTKPATDGSEFAAALGGALDEVQQLQATSNDMALKAVTGDLTDIHTATLASARASLALEMAATFRNRGIEAFNEIMRMQA
ncbi:flagellar hook-basal body complex protein FliE [Glutamicibacter sp. MCAF14]|jgi:flagellar hook-basal body complex protein FliE|uniref:flagellar hook-basal body complex protein FliE n=1 Tax=Glutamicibacter sp. MCAF14 TaxID=3233043 RepID=UPI003F9392E5